MPTHYKAIFLEAREYYKLGEIEKAKELIESGLKVCEELKMMNIDITFNSKGILSAFRGRKNRKIIILEGFLTLKEKFIGVYSRIYRKSGIRVS